MKNDNRPHIKKLRFFLKKFDGDLISNEFDFKLKMILNGKKCTYNPDFFFNDKNIFIEVCTSMPNFSEQGPKWRKALKMKFPLKIYYWRGQDITENVRRNCSISFLEPFKKIKK